MLVKIENFTDTELSCHCCGKLNYSNEFLIRLQAFRYMLKKGLIVTSPCRCIENNKRAGGVETSLHECETKEASAIDVTNSNCKEIYIKACKCGLFNEVIWYKKKNIVHLGLDKKQTGNFFIKK